MKAKNDSVGNKDSLKRILLLGGSGKQGGRYAPKLVASDLVSEVGIAGRNLERLDRAVTKIGNKAHAVQVDILDEHRLASVAADYDIILNTAGPEYEVLLPALRFLPDGILTESAYTIFWEAVPTSEEMK